MKTYGRRRKTKNALNVAPVNHLKRQNKFVEDLPELGEEDSQAVEPWNESGSLHDNSQYNSQPEEEEGEDSSNENHAIDDFGNSDKQYSISEDDDSEAETQPAEHDLFNKGMPPSTQPRNWTRKRVAMESPLQDRGNKVRVAEVLGAPTTTTTKTVRFEGPMSSSPVILSSEMSRPSPSQAPITPITPADLAHPHPPSTPDKCIVGVVPSTTPSYSPLTMKFDNAVDGGVARRLFETEGANKGNREASVFDDTGSGDATHEMEARQARNPPTTETTSESQHGAQHSQNDQPVAASQWQDEVLGSGDEEEDEEEEAMGVVPSSSQDQQPLGGSYSSLTGSSSVHASSSMPAPSSASSIHHYSVDPEETVDETPTGYREVSFAKSTQEESQYVPGETQYGPGESLYEPEDDSDDLSETQRGGDEEEDDDSSGEEPDRREESQRKASQRKATHITRANQVISDSQYCPNDELLEDVNEANDVETNDELLRDGQGYDWSQSQATTRSQSQRQSQITRPIEVSDDEPAASLDVYHDAHEYLGDTRDGAGEVTHSISDDDQDGQDEEVNEEPGDDIPRDQQQSRMQIIVDSDDDESQELSPFKQPTQPRSQMTQPPKLHFTQPSASLKRLRPSESQEPQPITESQLLMSGLFVDSASPHNDDEEEDVVIPVRRQNEDLEEDEYVSDSQDEEDVFPRPSLKREAFSHLPPLPAKPSITSSDMETQAYIGHSITDTLMEPLSDPDSLTQDE